MIYSQTDQGTQQSPPSTKNQTMPCTSEVLEKNISKNVITMTPCGTTPIKAASSAITTVTKATNSSISFTKTVPSPKENGKRTKSMNSKPESTKGDAAQSLASNNVSKPVVLNTTELAGRIASPKNANAENSKNNANKTKETTQVAPKIAEAIGEISPKSKDTAVTTAKTKDAACYVASGADFLAKNTDATNKSIPLKIAQQSCFSKINSKTTSIR